MLDLHKVLFVPELKTNLLSVPDMALMGAEIRFNRNECVVLKGGKEFVIGNLIDNKLYTVNTSESAQITTTSNTPSPEIWHCRFGHLNYTYIDQLVKRKMVNGMLFDEDSGTVKECEACVRGKMKKETFSKQSEHRAIRPYELIHSDLCGPMQVESKGGSKYILTFTDDHTRYTTAYFIKSKSETLSKFKEYVQSVDKQAGEKVKKLNILTERNDVKIIRSNNGGEYS